MENTHLTKLGTQSRAKIELGLIAMAYIGAASWLSQAPSQTKLEALATLPSEKLPPGDYNVKPYTLPENPSATTPQITPRKRYLAGFLVVSVVTMGLLLCYRYCGTFKSKISEWLPALTRNKAYIGLGVC